MENNINNKTFTDCEAKGICSIDPTIGSLWEVLFLELKQIAFYGLKLHNFGYHNQETIDTMLKVLSIYNSTADFNHDQFKDIISDLWERRNRAQKFYRQICEENSQDCEVIRSQVKIKPHLNISELIKWGEQYARMRNRLMPQENIGSYTLLMLLLKFASETLLKIKNLGGTHDQAVLEILKILNLLNYPATPKEKLIEKIREFAKIDNEMNKILDNMLEERYGKVVKTQASLIPKEGRAILACTADLKEFEELLLATQTKGINVYTYGDLILAHQYPEIKKFPHLAGHVCENESPANDFANFPGSVLLGRNAIYTVDCIYRGRIYSTDLLVSTGIIKIKDGDFKPLVVSAFDAKGFDKNEEILMENTGYDLKETDKEIKKAIEAIKEKKSSYIVICQDKDELKGYKDGYVIRLDFRNNLVFYVLEQLLDKNINVKIIFSRCDSRGLDMILNMLHYDFIEIYLSDCPIYVVNPHLIGCLYSDFNVKKY